MKDGIHPNYRDVCFVDLSNGFKFVTRSCAPARETIKMEVCTLQQEVMVMGATGFGEDVLLNRSRQPSKKQLRLLFFHPCWQQSQMTRAFCTVRP